ncbi:6-bladed beta-propeller [Rhodohalobacter sp.]|uniref:6-bladed beta-propeller n=1 Tax=Rhodohalobacter sp. TaxID=1974210 RepID=UPI0035690156
MNRSIILYTAAGIVVFSIAYFMILKPFNNSSGFVKALDASVEEFDRSYRNHHSSNSIVISDTTTLFQPAHVRKFKNKIYVSDFSDYTIYEYDVDGRVTRTIETGKGEGPGEFINLTDFDIINDRLLAVDSQSLRITSISLNTGEVLKSISVDRRPYRITCLKDGFIVNWLGNEMLFSKFDYEGNELFEFGKVIEDQLRHVLSVSGTIRSNRHDNFVYIPSYASLIYFYNGEGELINILKAPDGLEFPVTKREGAVSSAPDFSFYRDGYINENNKLYVYTNLPGTRTDNGEWEGDSLSVIDKYDLVTGSYEASIVLPFMHSSAMYDPETNSLFTSNWEKAFKHLLGDDVEF